jgi:unsaturated rhamnogalacturonyl hydrolase
MTAELLRRCFADDLRAMVEDGFSDTTPLVEMALEALCEWHVVDPGGGWLEPVDWFWDVRGWRPGDRLTWSRRAFASHEDALARARGDERIARAFVDETALMLTIDRRDDDGLVYFWDYRQPERRPLAADYMQEFAARLASAAALGGDEEWFDVAALQFVGYADALRDPRTGLWSLGRDWGDKPGTVSPGAWSRGHGWVVRGLVETLRWLPDDHPGRPALRTLLVETLEALVPRQDAEGMWHVLIDRPWDDSEAETSGTSLIAYGIARAVTNGDLPGDPWAGVAAKAIDAVCARVDARGIVHGVCGSPGLLWDEDELRYLRRPLPPGDSHGRPTVLYACLGARLLAARP